MNVMKMIEVNTELAKVEKHAPKLMEVLKQIPLDEMMLVIKTVSGLTKTNQIALLKHYETKIV